MQEELNAVEIPMPEPTERCEKEWKPSKQEVLREYEISIRFLNRGCIVRVGCKEIAFEDVSNAMAQLNEYVAGDTYEIQNKWRKLLEM